jgi:phosphate transport system substrate-binding protein
MKIAESSFTQFRGTWLLVLLTVLVASPVFKLASAQTAPSSPTAPTAQVDPLLPAYTPRTILSGRLRTVGSDTMDGLLRRWEASLHQFHPNLKLFCEGRGSSTALPSLTKGLSDFGPMSRTPTADEITRFQSKYGYSPAQVRVALDSLAVYVHPENPIAKKGLTIDELDAIFSSTRKGGCSHDITTWGDLGLTGEWQNAPIQVYSRNTASGTYTFFRDHVLKGGDFKKTNHELVGSVAVVAAVAADRFAIGYSGIGYKTDSVATVPIAGSDGKYISTDPKFCYDGQYPLARYLYLTLNHKPDDALSPVQEEFLRFVLSQDGQKLVMEEGFFPLTAEIAAQERARLGMH